LQVFVAPVLRFACPALIFYAECRYPHLKSSEAEAELRDCLRII
jgi:hypothetical protein